MKLTEIIATLERISDQHRKFEPTREQIWEDGMTCLEELEKRERYARITKFLEEAIDGMTPGKQAADRIDLVIKFLKEKRGEESS